MSKLPLPGVRVLVQQVDLQPASVKVGAGVGASDQTEAVQRRFEVLYLDEAARIVRFLPDAESDSEPQLFVFEREGADAFEDEVCISGMWVGCLSPACMHPLAALWSVRIPICCACGYICSGSSLSAVAPLVDLSTRWVGLTCRGEWSMLEGW